MRYTVEVDGVAIEVDVRDGPRGQEVAIGGGPHRPARLVGAGPRLVLEQGTARRELLAEPDPLEAGRLLVTSNGRPPLPVRVQDARVAALARSGPAGRRGPRPVKSPMPGVVVECKVAAGQVVEAGQVLIILEAMKMQNELRAEGPALVQTVHARAGLSVAAGFKLLDLAPPPAP